MPKIVLDNFTPEQQVVLEALMFEGTLRGYEEILSALEHEYALSFGEDPYYGYYIKHVIDLIKEKYEDLSKQV